MIRKIIIIMLSVIGIISLMGLYVDGRIYVQGSTIKYTNSDNKLNDNKSTTNLGRKHLVELENLNVTDIEDKIEQSTIEVSTKEALDSNGEVDFKKYYKKTVFFGDSLTEFLSEAEILNENSVVATKGRNVITAEQDIEKIKSLNPERIIMLFGMNDVGIFSNTSDFKNNYINLVNKIKAELPKVDIYIESPLPVQTKAAGNCPRLTNDNVVQFRQAAKEVAETEGIHYVDITGLVNSDKYYEPDGIHFIYDFYPGLLKYLRTSIEMNNIK